MKECDGNYEGAMHYNCNDCKEDCGLRKDTATTSERIVFWGGVTFITLGLIALIIYLCF